MFTPPHLGNTRVVARFVGVRNGARNAMGVAPDADIMPPRVCAWQIGGGARVLCQRRGRTARNPACRIQNPLG
eukprot:3867548-Pyramimonas_sp.AAC.1